MKRLVIFVHGWSVTDTSTYGELPKRLRSEARNDPSLELDVRHLHLGKYVSFQDEVRLDDLARGFQAALEREVALRDDQRFVCITHSTGGPVVRHWWQHFYLAEDRPCPMSHLIMLAPANFGSALAQLGKTRLSRIVKSLFEGVEPGTGVLDWLELGSADAWALNAAWIRMRGFAEGEAPVFPFILTGQSIDRNVFDHLNNYTGEMGSDGVVRVAAANLNATYVRLEQEAPAPGDVPDRLPLAISEIAVPEPTAFALVARKSHSGEKMGIMRSVKDDGKTHPTVTALLRCLKVDNSDDYSKLRTAFERQTQRVIAAERYEHIRKIGPDATYFHDACSMVIFRFRDDQGHPLHDYRLYLTGNKNERDALPEGFFVDRQRNERNPNYLTYYLNYDRMHGMGPVSVKVRNRNTRVRDALPGTPRLGFEIAGEPDEGYAHYLPGWISASKRTLAAFLKPHQTTMVDIVLRRVVRSGAFTITTNLNPEPFDEQAIGEPI
jgi:hypothetical protein